MEQYTGTITNTKVTSTEYDSNFTVSPTKTTTYKVCAANDETKYKTCIVKVPNISSISLQYGSTSSNLSTISADTTINISNGDTVYFGYIVNGDGTVDLPTKYQTATWSDDSTTTSTKSETYSTDGMYTIHVTSNKTTSIVSHILTIVVTTPSAVVNSITLDKSTTTVESGNSVAISATVKGQYLSNGINVYYE